MKVVLLDRDGVINEDRSDYVKDWSEFQFISGSLEALARLTRAGYRILVITNQSVINRKLVSLAGLETIHRNMTQAVAAYGGKIEAIYYCPHVPEDRCGCRKPKAGLILQAQKDYAFDPAHVCMIGDSAKDIECAQRAGCGKTILVRTGYGRHTECACHLNGPKPDHVADDLKSAVEWLLQAESSLRQP
ncbi:MAG: D-glycero-beta-D-manno-heptose 1,7-bisphosphate 7-phosphatase [Deltaproteobacteria bacterium]|nr:D-glycero-beta-D-manno-heptose 1,7-bisphosphate 7-phosphatase [Deltaproteobacteria bacterium]